MADFPKLEWVTINGQNIPFVYPQHEKENGDFVTTGENNPLPTGDYGMTEGGLWIPKRVDDEGNTLTKVTGSNVEVLHVETDDEELNVPAGVNKMITGRIDVSDYRYLLIQFLPRAEGKTMDYVVWVYYYKADTNATMQRLEAIISNSTSNKVSDRIDVNYLTVSLRIENKSDEDHAYGEIYLLGVRQ